MLKWIRKKKKNNKGFSLVELIVVVAIMAILVGLVAPQYLKYVEKSKKSADVNNLDEMVKALQVGAADAGTDANYGLPAGTYTITINLDKSEITAENVTVWGQDVQTGIKNQTEALEQAKKIVGDVVPDYESVKLKSSKWQNETKDSNNKVTVASVSKIKAVVKIDGDGGTKVTYSPSTLADMMRKKTATGK